MIFKPYKCEICNKKFDEEEYQLTNDKNKCILHCEKKLDKEKCIEIYNNAFEEYVRQNAQDGEISFFNISFQNFLKEENYRKFKKLKFQFCRFYKNLHFANSEKVFFEQCHFYIDWEYFNYQNLITKRKYLFNYCEFHNKIKNKTFQDGNLKIIFNSKLFKNCKFHNDILIDKGIFNEEIFNHCKFYNIKLVISNSNVKKRFNLNAEEKEKSFIKLINFRNTIFDDKVKLKYIVVENDTNFNNTKFNDLVDFYNTEFEEINFIKTDFKGISVFSECKFKKDADFKYTTFEKIAIFRDAKFYKKIDLRDSIFKDESNFLNIKVNEINRETARIIKNSFEQQNNIIEANKFYALEMKEREKELEADLKKGKNFFEWLVFKIHGISSNHSQDWLLALFWVVSFSFLYSFLDIKENYIFSKNDFLLNQVLLGVSITLLSYTMLFNVIEFSKVKIIFCFFLVFLMLYLNFTNDIHFNNFANILNPFSIMTGKETLSFHLLIFKIIIAYLIYQLIISIRQNTRRK